MIRTPSRLATLILALALFSSVLRADSPTTAPATRPAEQVTVQIVNSAKIIDVKEPERSIHIEQRATGILMSVKGVVEGQEESVQFQARNATELKEAQPEAFAIYAKYADRLPTTQPQQAAQLRNTGLTGALRQMQLELRALGLDDDEGLVLLDPAEVAKLQRMIQSGQLRAPKALHDVDAPVLLPPPPPVPHEAIDKLMHQLRQIQPTLTPIPKPQQP